MDDEAEVVARYWCHMCLQMVDPILEVEMIKCPLCQSGFVEEMDSSSTNPSIRGGGGDPLPDEDYFGLGGGGGSESERTLSLWAPILLGMMNNTRRRRRSRRRLEFEDEDDEDAEYEINNSNRRQQHEGETEMSRELESIIRGRRRRSPAAILQLLHSIRAGLQSESDNTESENRGDGDDRDTNDREARDRERVILINPFTQTIIVQGGAYDPNNNSQNNNNQNPIGSLGDYFIGPGLDLLLQHLAENDPNRYGTPPAQKEAVEAMPTVKIEENLQCSVCLDDFEIGTEAKEMPCKHNFHSECILPWLELHSSCPVCRYQLPSDESKLDADADADADADGSSRRNNNNNSSSNNNGESSNNANPSTSGGEEEEEDGRNGNARRFSVALPWPLSSLFSSPGNENSSSTGSSTNAPGSAARTDEH